ncbi:MAG: hypothetical protein ACOC9Z_01985 [Chloroflexota bacterium]
MNFNWRTDEELGPDPDASTGAAETRLRSRRLLQVTVLLLVVMVAAAFLWRNINRQAERNREARELDVRSSHTLALRAAAQGDKELLTTLLSGRDPRWTETQQQLLDQDLLFDGSATALGFEPTNQEVTVSGISWAPDLQEAYVTTRHAYTIAGGELNGEGAWLEQTHVYRRGAQRWLLSPPEEAFWGPRLSQSGQYVTVFYHERDAATVEVMLPILVEATVALCDELSVPCSQEAPFEVHLDAEGDLLQRLQGDRYPRFLFGELSLPSPTLVGVGADEVSQKALAHGYAHYLLVAAAQRLLDFDCCRGGQFMDVLGASLAHELGYGPSPLRDVDYVEMVSSLRTLRELDQVWYGTYETPFTPSDRAQLAAFLEFLRRQSGASSAKMQRVLVDAFGFWGWVQPFLELDVVADRSGLEAAWRDFIFTQANVSQGIPDVRTKQTLKLICEDEEGQHALYAYDPLLERWTYEHDVRGRAPLLAPTPGDDGVVLFDRNTADPSRLPARLLIEGKETPLSGDLAPAYSLPSDPLGGYMPMWRVAQSGRTVDYALLLDLAQCDEEGRCPQRTLPGLPSWSPDGQQMAVWSPDSGFVTLVSRNFSRWQRSAIHSTQIPVWLDDGALALVPEGGAQIAIAEAGANGLSPVPGESLLSLDPVLAALEREADGRNWRFAQIYKLPGAKAIVGGVTLARSGTRHFFVARFDEAWNLTEITPLTYVPQAVVSSPDTLISPDGAWLTMYVVPPMILEPAHFVMLNLESGEIVLDTLNALPQPAHAHDWSADGQWLARVGRYHVELSTPTGDRENPLLQKYVGSGSLQCESLAWVNR